jgi:Protein of unknown function (DUF2510)
MTTEVAPVEPGAQLPPAGWYPEPGQAHVIRYWDGAAWTDFRRTPVVAGQQAPIVLTTPTRFRKTSHGFHLIMTICTLGLWAPVWLIMSIYNKVRSD